MEKITIKAIRELINFRNCFKNTIGYQKYEVNVFDALNKIYVGAGAIIDEFEQWQKSNTSNNSCNVPNVSGSFIVEKNITVPDIHVSSQYQKYPWDKMKNGDSFLIQGYSHKLQVNLATTGNAWCYKNNKNMKIVTRKEGFNLRVFMVQR